MSETLITDIAASVQAGDDDTALDAVIQQYITDWGLTETVAEWRIANYVDLRRWGYPVFQEYIDELVGVGITGSYVGECDLVNLSFPSAPENPATTAETLIDNLYYLIDPDSTDTFTVTGIPNPSTVTVISPEIMRDWSTYGRDVDLAGLQPSTLSWAVMTGTFVFKVDGSGEFDVEIISEGYETKTFIVLAEVPA